MYFGPFQPATSSTGKAPAEPLQVPPPGIAKPVAKRLDPEDLRGSAFTAVSPSRVSLRPPETRTTGAADRSRRSMSLGPVDADIDPEPLPDPSDQVSAVKIALLTAAPGKYGRFNFVLDVGQNVNLALA